MNRNIKLLLTGQIILAVALMYGYFLQSYMTDATKLDVAFTQAKTYNYIATTINKTIEEKLPPKVQDNFIQKAIVLKISNSIVTPENVRTVIQKPVQRAVKVIAEKGELQGDKVVVNTAKFKSQAVAETTSWDLPPKITEAINSSIKSIPDYITIVDTEKNPNSVIGKIVKTKTYLGYLENAIIVMAVAFIALLGLTIYLSREKWRQLVGVYAWFFVLTGAVLALISYLVPPLVSNIYLVPSPLDIEELYNNLAVSLLNYYLRLPGGYSIALIVIGVLMMVFNNEKVLSKLKTQTKKLQNKSSKSSGKKKK